MCVVDQVLQARHRNSGTGTEVLFGHFIKCLKEKGNKGNKRK